MKHATLTLLLCLVALAVACGGGGSGDSDGTGTLAVSMTDATTPDLKAVYVTISRVEVHENGANGDENGNSGWKVVGRPEQTYNLLDLVNGVVTRLGLTPLAAGSYTQMRLYLDDTPDAGTNLLGDPHPHANYVITDTNGIHELKVPSGTQSGLKLVHPITIDDGRTTNIILDFDASKSVVVAGSSGQWLLKPTIKILTGIERATVSGTVTDGTDALEGARVSAQSYEPEALPEDQVNVEAATLTETDGSYALLLSPDDYNIVAMAEGFTPRCTEVSLAAGDTATADFALSPAAATGTVNVSVTITGASADDSATVSFQQQLDCGAGLQTVEVAFFRGADGSAKTLTLPAGEYVVVTMLDDDTGYDTTITVPSGGSTTLDISH